jgi:hypothetical protein
MNNVFSNFGNIYTILTLEDVDSIEFCHEGFHDGFFKRSKCQRTGTP